MYGLLSVQTSYPNVNVGDVKFYLIEQKVFFRYFPLFQRYFSYWRNGGGLCEN